MSNRSEHVKKWRKTVKETMVKSMGGECCVCKYKKCNNALELHHIDPGRKEFSFGLVISNPKSWDKIVVELRKCVLVCSNCHREVHDGIAEIPSDHPIFNEDYVKHDNYYRVKQTPCVVCGSMKPSFNKTCSKECRSKIAGRVDWGKVDIERLRMDGCSFEKIGDLVGASSMAVIKRLKRIGDVRNNKNKYKSAHDPVLL